ncbi:J domain-containing protein [Achromobacter aloeverae]|uniref:J domain-containing protein n=1 Tax=Achromobacter aloeverae TaxID=1750518 RepID=A0A4Q1HF08_9BURK|nr:J domain-containing protein [Achromobacter aloeverae]RXN85255.1 hypothetical protein C7R54_22440 [Achromobacter aloeverae]
MAALPQQIQNAYARLSLDPGADAQAIQRAYAHALKQIDQESQAEAFDNLRAAYETAMAWACESERRATAVETATPAEDSEAAWHAWLERLLDREQAHPQAVLAAALRDERLGAPAAQEALETRIATVLAHDPWQRLDLFDAAVACFHWDTGNGRQLADRWTAAWIAQACSESLAWRAQPERDRLRQLDAVNAALANPTPTTALLTRHFFAMDELMSHYGYWLILRMPNHILQAWSQAYNAPGFQRPPAPKAVAPRASFKLNMPMVVVLLMLAMAVLRLIFYPKG